jgi:RNA polymerase sigma-70 factor (ECF subfamily)
MEEHTAITRLQQGDISGLAALVCIYQLRALRAAYLITQDRALAEDVVQNAFVRAYERIHQFDARRPFGPWFLRSVTREAVKAAMRRARDMPLEHVIYADEQTEADVAAHAELNPEALWEQAETRNEVWTALRALTPMQREVVVQRYYLNLSEAEMADRIGCPSGTIKSRLYVARERLRTLLRPMMNS